MKTKQIKVKKWIHSGELNNKNRTQASIINNCGRLLDDSCSHEILGEVLFLATDGKYYVITTEAVLGKANPEYVKDALERIKEEA
jgi:hypothetical protein